MIQLFMSRSKTASVYMEMYKTDVTPTKTNMTPKCNVNSKKVSKQTVTKFVTKVGTLYRYIICKMDQRTRRDANSSSIAQEVFALLNTAESTAIDKEATLNILKEYWQKGYYQNTRYSKRSAL